MHGPDGDRPATDGDSDADTDADTDSDTDSDTDVDGDVDGDSDPVHEVRPEQVCGMRGFSNVTGGTLRLTTLDCTIITECAGVVADGALDLRPTRPDPGGYESDGDCAGVFWFDCAVPPGDYDRLTVWGEDLGVPCFGGDMDDCEAPDCAQLPSTPVPEGCTVEGLAADQVCGPSAVSGWNRNDYSIVNTCRCAADWQPAGCLVKQTEAGPVFSPRAARCSECQPDPVCQSIETRCSVFDAPAEPMSLQFPTMGEPLTFQVDVGEWGPVVCEP